MSEGVESGRAEGLEVVSVVASVGSAVFLAGPVALLPFAFMAALAGAVCGAVAGKRDSASSMATVGAVAGIFLTFLYGGLALDRLF